VVGEFTSLKFAELAEGQEIATLRGWEASPAGILCAAPLAMTEKFVYD